MSSGLQEIAWSLVSGFHQRLTSDFSLQSEKPLTITEAARLAGLTFLLFRKENPYTFTNLSYEAERSGISQVKVAKLATEALESFSVSLPKNITIEEEAALLGIIHSQGCYNLPLAYNEGTSQRPLGAYYTPPEIADYIVALTVTPTLNHLAGRAKTEGIDPLLEILSHRTLDPACGTGVFLISAMNAYSQAMEAGIKNAHENGVSRASLRNMGVLDYREKIRQNMFGVDIDSGALEVTDVSLRLISSDTGEIENESSLGVSLRKGNSLISFTGLDGCADHRHYFSSSGSRSPFEWKKEFREILESGGFDFVVMNPPYERLKPNLAEFLRERLLTGERDIHLENFETYKQRLSEDVRYFRNSGEYQLSNRYTIDTHRLFIERSLQLSREGGKIGFIVPSTILGDLSSYQLRSSFFRENKIRSVDDFPETSKMFNGVTQSVSILTLERGGVTKSFFAKFSLNDIEDAKSQTHIEIPTEKVEKIVGQSLSIPQVDKKGWNLLSKLHRQPSIASRSSFSVRRGELDLTLDRDCIVTGGSEFRLIRGSNISRYTLRDKIGAEPEFVDVDRLQKKLGRSSRAKHINQTRIACQQVSNRTQRWRLKFTSVPQNAILANSCNYIVGNGQTLKSHKYYLLGILNSELMNWRFSLSNSNNHVSTRELTQLPIAVQEPETSHNLYKSLVKEVKRFKPGTTSTTIEALVFALYGFSLSESKDILKMRFTPQEESREILRALESIRR